MKRKASGEKEKNVENRPSIYKKTRDEKRPKGRNGEKQKEGKKKKKKVKNCAREGETTTCR